MSHLIYADTISEAWLSAVEFLLAQPNHRAVHLMLSVASAPEEIQGVRRCVDALLPSAGPSTELERVADTIFPDDLYDANEEDALDKLMERWKLSREFEAQTVPNGNYFDWMVDYPSPRGGRFNQIEHVLARLRSSHATGDRNSNECEIGVSEAGNELRIQTPGTHRRIMGFPCLSHISVTLCHGRVNLAATYRSQDFVHKAYGNLLGLGRLMQFLASESKFEPGELLCIATGAILTPPKQGGIAALRSVVSCVKQTIQEERTHE